MTHSTERLRPQGRAAAFSLPAFIARRNVVSDVVQGIIVGGVLAFFTFKVIAHAYATNVNGWTTMLVCGKPGNGILVRGACASAFPGPINAPQEAMYWTTKVDNAGQTLTGQRHYIIHFPQGQLPPNRAFWSLTMATAKNHFVDNPINRYSVSDRSGLVPNADSSIDIYIQNVAPAGHESNWLPAPTGEFILWLRVYLPDASVVAGKYQVPPVGVAR